MFRRTAIVARSGLACRLRSRCHLAGLHPGMVTGIFLAVDRRHMRGVSIEIRPANSKTPAVDVDPLPENIGGCQSLRSRCAFDTDDISRKPVAVTSAETAAMKGPVIGRFEAACDRLAIIIAEGAGY